MGRAAAAHPLLRTLDGILVIPPEHHRPDTGRADAAAMLACDEHTVSELIRHGLPATGERGRERLDSRDVFNLALYSGSGRTGAERGVAAALGWTRSSCEDLITPRMSRFELRVACGAPGGCAPGARNTLARPRTGAYGGKVRQVRAHPAGAARHVPAGTSATARASGPALTLSAVLRTVGDCPVLRSPALRAILREFMGAELRWLRLPEAMRNDESLIPRGFASCGSASRYIARLCREEGIPATTRIGWLVGLPDLVHAWVEVEDEDGVTKVIDPTFVLLSEVVPGANPMLRDPGIAFRTNRLIPTALGVGADIASHTCAAGHVPHVTTTLDLLA